MEAVDWSTVGIKLELKNGVTLFAVNILVIGLVIGEVLNGAIR